MNLEQKKNFLINFAFWALIGAIGLLVIRFVLPISLPFLFGFLFAYLIVALCQKIRCNNRWLRLLLAILLYGVIGFSLGLLTERLISAITELATQLPPFYEEHIRPAVNELTAWAQAAFQGLDPEILSVFRNMSKNIMEALSKLLSVLSKGLVSLVSGAASGVPATVLSIIMMIFSTFFVVVDAERIQEFSKKNMPPRLKAAALKMKEYLTGTLLVVLKSYLLIMLITFIELTLLFWIFGISKPAVKASLIAVLDILPLLGAGSILIPWAVISMIAGSVGKGIKLLIIYGIITLVRQYLEPKIVGTQLGLHPVITLISMFLGLRLFGFLGMFGMPLAVSFFWKEYRSRAAAKVPPEPEQVSENKQETE